MSPLSYAWSNYLPLLHSRGRPLPLHLPHPPGWILLCLCTISDSLHHTFWRGSSKALNALLSFLLGKVHWSFGLLFAASTWLQGQEPDVCMYVIRANLQCLTVASRGCLQWSSNPWWSPVISAIYTNGILSFWKILFFLNRWYKTHFYCHRSVIPWRSCPFVIQC